ncbi:LysE family transporter [Infirmifilum lucidum]|uniref:LysE family transporter n=1 Tax=Infirmifilum lucidum TaxID=2776706 RepID=A0A7L9FHZ3_9CREN|nr:LysE family transporter [Infirmifilum lucidum]QOJ78536.1 LysE family transporter [Infirmifilum lucidum]
MINPGLAFEVISLTASGALSPGPLTFAAILGGRQGGWRYGFLVAIGHTLFELPLYILLSLGVYQLLQSRDLQRVISIIGGVVVLFFVYLSIQDLLRGNTPDSINKHVTPRAGPVAIGFTFTAFNPYFLAWWATVGVKMVSDIIDSTANMLSALSYYPVHVWMDFAWLSSVSLVAEKGFSTSYKLSKGIQALLILLMAYYSLKFLMDAFT